MSCGCGCRGASSGCESNLKGVRYVNIDGQNFMGIQGGYQTTAHLAANGRLGAADMDVRYLNRPRNFAGIAAERYFNPYSHFNGRPVRGSGLIGRVGSIGAVYMGTETQAAPAPCYIFYLDTNGYTMPQGPSQPYSYMQVPASYFGNANLTINNPPPFSLKANNIPNTAQIQWQGQIDAFGTVQNLMSQPFGMFGIPAVIGPAQALAKASPTKSVSVGVMIQTISPQQFAQDAAAMSATPVTSAPTSSSGASSSYVAPIVTSSIGPAGPNPMALASQQSQQGTSSNVAPSTVTITSTAALPVADDSSDVNPSSQIGVNAPTSLSTMDWLLIAALAAVVVL